MDGVQSDSGQGIEALETMDTMKEQDGTIKAKEEVSTVEISAVSQDGKAQI